MFKFFNRKKVDLNAPHINDFEEILADDLQINIKKDRTPMSFTSTQTKENLRKLRMNYKLDDYEYNYYEADMMNYDDENYDEKNQEEVLCAKDIHNPSNHYNPLRSSNSYGLNDASEYYNFWNVDDEEPFGSNPLCDTNFYGEDFNAFY